MSELTEILSPISKELDEFKHLFDVSLSSSNPLLSKAIDHIKKSNGKMMRPILVLLLAKLYGTVQDKTFHAAVSLELLHTASLVHDDVVDESDKRRGQLSVNALFDNKVSVLVGDYLLATSLVEVSETGSTDIIKVIAQLGKQLSEGELLQLSNVSNHEFSQDVYFDVISKKTAALFAACAKVAALSAGASSKEVDNCTKFGEYLGVCFQIKDDIFDYSSSDDIGKPTGNDILEGKLTLPALYVLNNKANEEMKQIAIRIKDGEATDKDIYSFISYIEKSGGIEYAEKIMNGYHRKALDLLATLPDSAIKDSLVLYLDYIVNRDK